MMEYKTVPDDKNKRYSIVNKGTFGRQKECTSNLNDNELKIIYLKGENCPISNNRFCIDTNYPGVSSICDHMGFYPNRNNKDKLIIEQFPCRYDDPLVVNRKVTVLKVEGCPTNEKSCLGCNHIKGVVIPSSWNLEKSHAHIVCGKVEK